MKTLKIWVGEPTPEDWLEIGRMIADGNTTGIDQPSGINWDLKETRDEYEIQIHLELYYALWRVLKYIKKRGGGYTFTRKEIKHLLETDVETARFGDLRHFGGLMFMTSKAHYGLNIERCEEFFSDRLAIPIRGWKKKGHAQFIPDTVVHTLTQIPGLHARLNQDGYYVLNYTKEKPQPELF